ncbi:hypothetical protein K492DRAFT_174190 [Lichtheimia hyalospora FSU 10163]|nr:hypothetical protein K492DRAFT_174190 [Lichtheimia hyalospora FSU 10163]
MRCDGTKPNCLHCQEASITCEYSESCKRGPRKGYVQVLEQRIAQLERRLSNEEDYVSSNNTSNSIHPLSSSSSSSRINEKASDAPLLKGCRNPLGDDKDFYPPIDVVIHLVDLFFKHLNSVFPLVHRKTLKYAIHDGTVSRPLLWAIMAIGARFSEHPLMKVDPPYWAAERFAAKASSLVDITMLEPTIPNLQFWGIMACLEYGRGSGARAWMYGGLAIRICHELGLNKEETLSEPIKRNDGTIDAAAMALRRRIFWSCFALDKFASAGTGRPQYFGTSDFDATLPTVEESILLLDHYQCTSINDTKVTNDSLMDITRHYLELVILFGQVNNFITHIKSDVSSENVIWPPATEFSTFDARLQKWKADLPEQFQFNTMNVNTHKENASQNYLTIWLSSHAIWCTTMLMMHRASLAHSDIQPGSIPTGEYQALQTSINTCKSCIDEAMVLFGLLRELCGRNIWPYMGYSAYICATVLMTSTFSRDPESYVKSRHGLEVLYGMIDNLRPYWPMCERLALTTKDLLLTHTKLYNEQHIIQPSDTQDHDEYPTTTTAAESSTNQVTGTTLLQEDDTTQSNSPTMEDIQQQLQSANLPLLLPQQQSAFPLLQETLNGSSGDIDFNSFDFLYDSALFGQIMLDNNNTARPTTTPPSTNELLSSMFASQHEPFLSDIVEQDPSGMNQPPPMSNAS